MVIIGGAIMGSFVAWSLRRQGYGGPITVIERDMSYAFASTARSAASIRTQFGTPLNVAMSLYGVEFLRAIRDHFGARAEIGYREQGYLILGRPQDVAARRAGVAMQRAAGADVVDLTPEELGARFGWLNLKGVGIGTFGQSGEGWFDAWSLLSLVRRAARDLGVSYLEGEVSRLIAQDGRIAAVALVDGRRISGDGFVMAAGAASGRLCATAGVNLPVSPRKRSVFCFRAPLEEPAFPMLFDISGVWVRPEGQGFIGGIQPAPEDDPDATGDFEPHHALIEEAFWPHLAHRIPAMEQMRHERSWAGHYEVNMLDHNGVVGPHDRLRNLIFATGFSGHGVMHAPAVGRAVAEWIIGGRYASLDMAALGWERIRDNRPMVETVVY